MFHCLTRHKHWSLNTTRVEQKQFELLQQHTPSKFFLRLFVKQCFVTWSNFQALLDMRIAIVGQTMFDC